MYLRSCIYYDISFVLLLFMKQGIITFKAQCDALPLLIRERETYALLRSSSFFLGNLASSERNKRQVIERTSNQFHILMWLRSLLLIHSFKAICFSNQTFENISFPSRKAMRIVCRKTIQLRRNRWLTIVGLISTTAKNPVIIRSLAFLGI